MSDLIDEHRIYLSDEPRLAAYEAAISERVRPGATFIDLGAGTGIWGLMAARAGAGRVYGLEATSLVGTTQEIADANGFASTTTCVPLMSTEAELPELADVVCCDQIGRFGFEAGVFSYFADAARRLAKPGAHYIPSHIEFYAAPVASEELAAAVRFWRQTVKGFDVSALAPVAENSGYPCRLEASDLVCDGALLVRRPTTDPDSFSGTAEFVVESDVTIDGFGGWFRAELADSIFITNGPGAKERVRRKNVFLPLGESIQARAGDGLRLRCHFIPSETVLSWTVEHQRQGETSTQKHSTFQGMFLASDDLRRTRPDFVPVLSERGRARKRVLDLCDGITALATIETRLQNEFEGLFRDRQSASCFVAEVVTRYAK